MILGAAEPDTVAWTNSVMATVSWLQCHAIGYSVIAKALLVLGLQTAARVELHILHP